MTERVRARMVLERERMDLKKSENWMKMETEKTKTFDTLQLEKEKLKIMLQKTSLMVDQSKFWFGKQKKEIIECKYLAIRFTRVSFMYELLILFWVVLNCDLFWLRLTV